MPIFQLLKPTTATLTSVTPRSESHGDDQVPAVSLGLTFLARDVVADMLCPELRPLLHVQGIDTIALTTVCEGWTITMQHGIGDDSAIKLGGCKLDKFKLSPGNDGMVELRLRAGSHDIDPLALGTVGMKVGQDVVVVVTAPKVAMQTNSSEQHAAMKTQREREAHGQKRVDDPEPDTPEKALARATKRASH